MFLDLPCSSPHVPDEVPDGRQCERSRSNTVSSRSAGWPALGQAMQALCPWWCRTRHAAPGYSALIATLRRVISGAAHRGSRSPDPESGHGVHLASGRHLTTPRVAGTGLTGPVSYPSFLAWPGHAQQADMVRLRIVFAAVGEHDCVVDAEPITAPMSGRYASS
jgi:hypothetical protein